MKTKIQNSLVLVTLILVFKVNVASAFLDPNLGRWIQRDPIGESGGLNLYAYVGNNPVNKIDPFGLQNPVSSTLPGFAGAWNSDPYGPNGSFYGAGYLYTPEIIPYSGPNGIFFFAGGELPAPGGAGAAMDYEGATFLDLNSRSHATLGSFNCITTKGAGRIGTGQESGFSSANGAYVEPVNIFDAHLPTPGISPGIGNISTPNENNPYFYLQFGKGGAAGVFVGVGLDFNKKVTP